MFYREAGVFKTSYAADMALFPLPQARWAVAASCAGRADADWARASTGERLRHTAASHAAPSTHTAALQVRLTA